MDIDLLWALGGWFLDPNCMATTTTTTTQIFIFIGLFLIMVLLFVSNPTDIKPTMMKPLSSSSSIQMPARRLQLHDQTFDAHPSSSSSSRASKARKKNRRQFEASAHEVPSGPNPISNR
ncbi:hypothetical protein ACHQM5_014002 [Ranunculus cassubicifolius]